MERANEVEGGESMRYYVLQRNFDNKNKQFDAFIINARDESSAWEASESRISNSYSQEWLMTKKELEQLKKLIGRWK